MTVQKRSYSAGHFELVLDGHVSTAYVKSVDGGYARTQAIDEPIGPANVRIKHASVAEIEPMTLDMGIAGARHVLEWIRASWSKKFMRRNGSITHATFDLQRAFEHEFYDALIAETTFPALDTASKEASFMKVKIQPERVVTRKASGGQVQGTLTSKQKLWTPSSFRFNIDGIDDMRHTNKIEALTIKQGIKKFYTGEDRFPQIEPTKIEFPNITGTISLEFADKLLAWYDDYVVRGQNDKTAQKSGSIEFLTPDRKQTIFAINLYEVGIIHAQIAQSQGNADAIKRVKFEMYVGHMELDLAGGALGLE